MAAPFLPAAPAHAAPSVLFAVENNTESGGAMMEPIALWEGNRFTAPPSPDPSISDVRKDGRLNAFITRYLSPGRTYRLLFGGGVAGTVAVTGKPEVPEIVRRPKVRLQTRERIAGQVMALATDARTAGTTNGSTRRAPTPAERAQALALARAAYRRRGLSPALVSRMAVRNLTAVDVDGDQKAEMIGSFMIEVRARADVPGPEHALFLVAEPNRNGYRAALEWYHRGEEVTVRRRKLVDVLDLDGDGMSEIIAHTLYYESWDFAIYQKKRGRAATWRTVYQGGGGGV